ncbi:unnamed protein product [Rotaria sp. Silwood1]|nr:unnamed protein product [Rotaria sp. Silwood1]
MYASLEILKESRVIEEISNKVHGLLKQKGQTARFSSITKASKNAVSLWLSKKKGIKPTSLSIYLPMNIVESLCDTVVPNLSSDEDNSPINITENDSNISEDSQSPFSSPLSQNRHISLSFCDNLVTADVTPMNLEKIVSDVCVYVFLELKCSVNIRALKNEISLQISHIVQAARVEAAGKIEVEPMMGFSQYRNNNYLSPILLIRKTNEQIDILQFYPFPNIVEITFNELLIKKALSSFQLSRTLDINELISLVTECALTYNLNFDLSILEEALKTKILFNDTSFTLSPFFLNVVLKLVQVHEVQTDFDQTPANDSCSYSVEEIDAIIGRTYSTRGVKRSYEEDPILVEPNKNMHRQNKIKKDKRDLLHLKDTYHLTDSALNAIFQYVRSKKKLYSLKEIERLRKETNKKFPIIYTKISAYVRFEYAVRTAIFVARKYEQKLEQFDILNIRFNMDGTLIGNKHIVAISINCIEGGHNCQMAKNLVPLALFEVQKENTELLRKSLPTEFIDDVKSVKYISIGAKHVNIHVRLGGDLMNAVYVFGLAGFSSNHPCVFCTQHKDDLYVTEETAYDKCISEGKGKNKKITTVHVGPTSYHDPTKLARSLEEQRVCLEKKVNDLGYKCEPLFGDLFDYQDYCVDTLHMKL